MVIPPVWHIGSSRRRIERNNSQLEELSQEDKEILDSAGRAVKYIGIALTSAGVLAGLLYISYQYRNVPDSAIRAAYAP